MEDSGRSYVAIAKVEEVEEKRSVKGMRRVRFVSVKMESILIMRKITRKRAKEAHIRRREHQEEDRKRKEDMGDDQEMTMIMITMAVKI